MPRPGPRSSRGEANGFFIFLLKGFFDSLPRELYEAADIDGAGEWSKFWIITMSLSKPILAVLALGAFNSAYSEFMMALVIIPDKNMWTLMIWLFQLQGMSHTTVIYASLVIAAIPTFIIFLQSFVDLVRSLPENEGKSDEDVYVSETLNVASVR